MQRSRQRGEEGKKRFDVNEDDDEEWESVWRGGEEKSARTSSLTL